MKNRNIVISLLFLLIAFSYKRGAGQMPAGMEPDFKPTSYKYQDWRIRKGDTVQMGDSSRAVVKALEQYKINGWEKMYLRLRKMDGTIIERELVSMLWDGTLVKPFPGNKEIFYNPYNHQGNYIDVELYKRGYLLASNGIKYKVGDSVELGYGSSQDSGYTCLSMTSSTELDFYALKSAPRKEWHLGKNLKGTKLPILAIRSKRVLNEYHYYFLVEFNKGAYELWIENAINKCEIVPCTKVTQIANEDASAADEILKYKKLMDDGIITREEFEAKKLQLLSK